MLLLLVCVRKICGLIAFGQIKTTQNINNFECWWSNTDGIVPKRIGVQHRQVQKHIVLALLLDAHKQYWVAHTGMYCSVLRGEWRCFRESLARRFFTPCHYNFSVCTLYIKAVRHTYTKIPLDYYFATSHYFAFPHVIMNFMYLQIYCKSIKRRGTCS